jgi:hypothetical protein
MSDLRDDIASALEGWMTQEQLKELLDEILASKKKGRAEFVCKGCGKKQIQYAEIPDARAVTSALVELANQGFGRPKEAVVSDGEKIHFERVVYLGSDAEV